MTVPEDSAAHASPGPGWWRASDGNWYPPEQHPDYRPGQGPAGADHLGQSACDPGRRQLNGFQDIPMMPPPPASARVGPLPETTPAAAVGSPESGRLPFGRAAGNGANGNGAASFDGAVARSALLRNASHEDHSLADEAKRAVARARAIDTPESWQEAARLAMVVAQMAQTMRVVTDAKQEARQKVRRAEQGREQAEVAASVAAEAAQTEERSAEAATNAAQAARDAARAAADAGQDAERAAQAASEAERTADVTARAAADAKGSAQLLAEIVAQALATNTPEAWSQARQLTEAATRVPAVGETPTGPDAQSGRARSTSA